MIYTVFCTSTSEEMQWQSELLEYSWGRARQPGELVRLVSSSHEDPAPAHRLARVVKTLSWSPHPYTGDLYPPYHKAAALLEWLFTERIEGTILLLEPNSVFRSPVTTEIGRGQAKATVWSDLPRGDGPFGLGSGFDFLEKFCVDRTIELPSFTLPVMIHSSDLRKIVARWLELMSIIRAETAGKANGPLLNADDIAYVIAAAEAGIQHTAADLSVGIEAQQSIAPIIEYLRPIASTDGEIVWDPGTYRSWDPVQPDRTQPGPDREILTQLAEFIERRALGLELAFLKPCRHKGVREGKILGSMFLDIPGRADTVSLNSSGAAIWEACDGNRSFDEINQELETRFEMPSGSLRADVEVVIKRLERIGALRLEPV